MSCIINGGNLIVQITSITINYNGALYAIDHFCFSDSVQYRSTVVLHSKCKNLLSHSVNYASDDDVLNIIFFNHVLFEDL